MGGRCRRACAGPRLGRELRRARRRAVGARPGRRTRAMPLARRATLRSSSRAISRGRRARGSREATPCRPAPRAAGDQELERVVGESRCRRSRSTGIATRARALPRAAQRDRLDRRSRVAALHGGEARACACASRSRCRARVFTARDRVGAGASTALRDLAECATTLGESLAKSGFFVRRAHARGSRAPPCAGPWRTGSLPPCTFGHERLTSSASTGGCSVEAPRELGELLDATRAPMFVTTTVSAPRHHRQDVAHVVRRCPRFSRPIELSSPPPSRRCAAADCRDAGAA